MRIIILLVAMAAVLAAASQKTSTRTPARLKPLPVASSAQSDSCLTDTIVPAASPTEQIPVKFYGYDKKLRSTKETFFISNTDSFATVTRACVTLEYFDAQGRLLHSRPRRIDLELEPGKTEVIDIPSWDRQQSFYYRDSQRPRVSAVPYDIRINVDTLILRY